MRLISFRKATKLSLLLATTLVLVTACDEKKVVTEDEVQEVAEVAKEEVITRASDANLTSSLVKFLEARSEAEQQPVKTIITDNFNSVTGLYAYPVKVMGVEKTVTILDLGLSTIEVPLSKVVAHDNFMETVSELRDASEGLALVTYKDNRIEHVEIYQLEHNTEVVGSALAEYDASKFKATEKESSKEKNESFKDLTVKDWQGMALLTSRHIISQNMAPIFLVPRGPFSKDEMLTDTFYYIVAGTVLSSNEKETKLFTSEGRTITMDFGIKLTDEQKEKPAWIHIITNKGSIENIEVQTFKDADIEVMSQGVLSHIEVSSVISSTDKDE